MSTAQVIQIVSISTALIASGGIAVLSLFDVPLLKSQQASRSLPMIRWLFSRGSHIFPTAALLSSSGFAYLAYSALPTNDNNLSNILYRATTGNTNLYVAASVLTISIAPMTGLMVPTNFALIKMNEEKGGTKSAASSDYREGIGAKRRTADESVDNKDDISQWSDLSGPQEKTAQGSTEEEDQEVRRFLNRFGKLNMVRAMLIGAGGVVGLMGALA